MKAKVTKNELTSLQIHIPRSYPLVEYKDKVLISFKSRFKYYWFLYTSNHCLNSFTSSFIQNVLYYWNTLGWKRTEKLVQVLGQPRTACPAHFDGVSHTLLHECCACEMYVKHLLMPQRTWECQSWNAWTQHAWLLAGNVPFEFPLDPRTKHEWTWTLGYRRSPRVKHACELELLLLSRRTRSGCSSDTFLKAHRLLTFTAKGGITRFMTLLASKLMLVLTPMAHSEHLVPASFERGRTNSEQMPMSIKRPHLLVMELLHGDVAVQLFDFHLEILLQLRSLGF